MPQPLCMTEYRGTGGSRSAACRPPSLPPLVPALLGLAGPRFQKPQGAGLDRHRVGRECASWALPSLGRRPGKTRPGRLGGAPQRGCTVKAHRSPGGSVRAVEATAARASDHATAVWTGAQRWTRRQKARDWSWG